MKTKKALILAGGTGGHVYPALAIAKELQHLQFALIWLGLAQKIEARVAHEAGIEFKQLNGTGVRGKNLLVQCLSLMRIARDIWTLFFWLGKQQPAVAFGFGGYSSVAAGIACWLRRIPLIIHEQNARAGASNRLLGKIATRICLGYVASMQSKKATVTGNPVRKELLAIKRRKTSGALRLLVLGGSLGAQSINTGIISAMAQVDIPYGLHVTHQCGEAHYRQCQQQWNSIKRARLSNEIYPFLQSVDKLYASSDLVLCRAGAMTLSELAICRLPAMLLPFPRAMDDHQTANARVFVGTGGGWMLADEECTAENLCTWLHNWTQQTPAKARKQLRDRGEKLKDIAMPAAGQRIVEQGLQIMRL